MTNEEFSELQAAIRGYHGAIAALRISDEVQERVEVALCREGVEFGSAMFYRLAMGRVAEFAL